MQPHARGSHWHAWLSLTAFLWKKRQLRKLSGLVALGSCHAEACELVVTTKAVPHSG